MDLSWLGELLRSVLWGVCKICFTLMDFVYDVLKDLAKLNLGDFDFIWKWWKGICVFLTFFILIRVIIQYFKATLDEDLLEKYDPTVTIKRLAVIAFLVLMLPIMMDGFSGLASEATSDIGQIITGIDIETKPSKVILSAGYSNGDASATKDLDFKEVDINEVDEASDDYVLYPELFDLVFAFISSIISCVIFVFVGIQISQRIVGLLLKILISPFALSGVIDPGDNTFSIWTKLCVADFLTTFFQILLVMLVITVSTVVPLSNPIAKTVFFIGALMAIMNAPTGIAQLLGGDVGTGTAFQQVQSLMMLGTGVQLAGSAMSAISAGGFYGAGRWLGGRSLIGSGLAGTAMNNGIRPESSSGSMSYPGGGPVPSASASNMQAGAEAPAANISSDVSDSGVIGSQASGFRMTNPDSVLGRIADFNAQDGPGSMVNRAASSLYMRSAQRLSRPVQYRSVRGGVGVRQSRIVSTSRALHETANNLHHLGNAANEEPNRR